MMTTMMMTMMMMKRSLQGDMKNTDVGQGTLRIISLLHDYRGI